MSLPKKQLSFFYFSLVLVLGIFAVEGFFVCSISSLGVLKIFGTQGLASCKGPFKKDVRLKPGFLDPPFPPASGQNNRITLEYQLNVRIPQTPLSRGQPDVLCGWLLTKYFEVSGNIIYLSRRNQSMTTHTVVIQSVIFYQSKRRALRDLSLWALRRNRTKWLLFTVKIVHSYLFYFQDRSTGLDNHNL